MSRRLPLLIVIAASLVLSGCFSSEPNVTEEEQVSATQREQMQAAEQPDEGDEEQPDEGDEADQGDGGGGGETLTFVAVDIAYDEAPSEAPAGPQTFELVNDGAIEHNVVVEELGDELIVEAQGGETQTGEVELDEGDYTFYCNIPGHREAGMEGSLSVSG